MSQVKHSEAIECIDQHESATRQKREIGKQQIIISIQINCSNTTGAGCFFYLYTYRQSGIKTLFQEHLHTEYTFFGSYDILQLVVHIMSSLIRVLLLTSKLLNQESLLWQIYDLVNAFEIYVSECPVVIAMWSFPHL